jgi:hypothetical protein
LEEARVDTWYPAFEPAIPHRGSFEHGASILNVLR